MKSKFTRLLLALVVPCGFALAQTNRFPPINTYTGDPTGVACTIPNSIVQSDSTGGIYSCIGGVYVLPGASIPGVSGNGANGLNVAGSVTATNGVIGPGPGLYSVPVISNSGLHAFGDSTVTNPCTGGGGSANCAEPKLAAYMSASLTDYGVSGSQGCDSARLQMFPNENPASSGNPLFLLRTGINDANFKGVGSYEAVFNLCHQATISWLAIPSIAKVYGQSASVTLGGTWVADDTIQAGIAEQSTTNGSTASFPVTTYGGPIYIWYRIIDGNGGVFTYSLDGAAAVSVNGFTSPAIATHNAGTEGVALVRIPGVAAGSHTVLITVTSATNASNKVSILAVGNAPQTSYYQSQVVVGGVIKQLNDQTSAATAAYNADALANAVLLHNDGLQVIPCDVRKFIFGTPAEMSDQFHPNSVGYAEIYDAYRQCIQPVPYSGYPATVASLDSSRFTSTQLLSNAITSGLNFYFGASGLTEGQFFGNPSTGGYWHYNVQPSNFGGWKFCDYPQNTPLTSLTQLTGCVTMPNPGSSSYIMQLGKLLLTVQTNATVSDTCSTDYISGGTYTLTNSGISQGRVCGIVNYSTTTATTITGAANNIPASVPPLTSIMIQYEGGLGWYMISYGGGAAVATTSTTGVVKCDGTTISCAGDGTITAVGATAGTCYRYSSLAGPVIWTAPDNTTSHVVATLNAPAMAATSQFTVHFDLFGAATNTGTVTVYVEYGGAIIPPLGAGIAGITANAYWSWDTTARNMNTTAQQWWSGSYVKYGGNAAGYSGTTSVASSGAQTATFLLKASVAGDVWTVEAGDLRICP